MAIENYIQSWIFQKKNLIALKIGKKGPKWTQNEFFFSIFQKTLSLVVAGNGLKERS